MIGVGDVILFVLVVAVVALVVGVGVIGEGWHRWQCRRRARMAPWQRRALTDGEPRGFEVIKKG